jgi:MFS family permease
MATTHTPRFFYGWLIVLIAFFSAFVIAGTFVTFGQFINPLGRAFGWSVGLIGLASTVRQLTTMAAALVVGRLTDRAGPRRVMFVGALVAGVTYLLLYFLADPLVFYLLFTVGIAIGFSMIGGTPAQAAVARWFRSKRGLALAITSMGGSLGGVVMAPAVQYLLTNGDWHIVFAVIGGGILMLLLPLIALAMRDDPVLMGVRPDGDPPLAGSLPAEPVTAKSTLAEPRWTYRTLFNSRNFWMLTLGYLFASTLYTLIEVYQFPILTSRGLDGATAAWFISIYSLSAALSKFGWGYLADRVDLRKLIMLALCANSVALVMLAFATALPVIWFYTLLGGASGGGQSSLLPALIAQKFGHRSFGTVAGLFLPLSMIAPAIAVPLAGFVFDATHTYTVVFVITAALAMVGSTVLLKLPEKRGGMAAASV